MATEPFLGRWKITTCIPDLSQSCEDAKLLEGCEVELCKDGDVFWFPVGSKNPRNPDPGITSSDFPLFHCDTFEVLRRREGLSVVISLRFGASRGHVIEFEVEVNNHWDFHLSEGMSLTYPGLFVLHCKPLRTSKQLSNSFPASDSTAKTTRNWKSFDLLPALEEGFFTDMEVQSANGGKTFQIHKTVIEYLLATEQSRNALNCLSEKELEIMLHFLYGQCLVPDVDKGQLNSTLEKVKDVPELERFFQLGQEFKTKSKLCEKMHSLLNEIHGLANAIILEFGGRPVQPPSDFNRHHHQQQHQDLLVQSPGRLSHVIKQSLRHFCVGFVKMVHLGHLFVTNKNELNRDEQNEIITFAKHSLPIFLTQAHRFLTALKHCSNSINLHLRQQLAAHFVSELESFTEMLSFIGCHIKDLLEAVIATESDKISEPNNPDPKTSSNSTSEASSGFHFFSDYQDCNINSFNYKVNGSGKFKSLQHTLQIKDLFNLKMTHRHFVLILSYLTQERETFVKQLPAGKVRLLSWQIDQLIDELPLFILRLEEFTNMLEERLEYGTFKFCFIVGTTVVENMLQKFKEEKTILQPLLEHLCSLVQSDSLNASLHDLGLLEFPGEDFDDSLTLTSDEHTKLFEMNKDLTFDKSLCVPPDSIKNELAMKMKRLFETKENADMTIAVVGPSNHSDEKAPETHEIKCHRVILAARCPFFRRALTSGMKESIERRMEVYDTSLVPFNYFLHFVYTGTLNLENQGGLDLLSELLLLGDLYELDSLKECCEIKLIDLIESETALTLISIADRFNAARLKDSCLDFIMENQDLVQSKHFQDLDETLQDELRYLISWDKKALAESMSPTPEGFSRVLNLAANLKLQDEIETTPLTHDSSQLENCVTHLRDVLGPLIDQDQLVQVALAADYDVNRALNYFFNSEPSDN